MTSRETAFQRLVQGGGFDGLWKGRAPVTVELPWPSPKLSPNARVHWGEKARASKAARAAAWALTRQAFPRKPQWSDVRLDIEFCPPSRRRYDADNRIASLKAAMDGIADALGIDDSKFIATYRMGEPVKGGLVRVVISEG